MLKEQQLHRHSLERQPLYLTKASDTESTENFHQHSKPLSVAKSADLKVTWKREELVYRKSWSDGAHVGSYEL
jgi:hypothetical protein